MCIKCEPHIAADICHECEDCANQKFHKCWHTAKFANYYSWKFPAHIGKQDNDCSTLAVPNGNIKRKVNCVNGKHVLKVSCLPGYTLYGRKKFTCNGGITGPPGMWPPSCVPDSGKCHTMICVLYHTEMKPTYHVI